MARSQVFFTLLLAPLLTVCHYTYPNLIVNGKITGEWQYVRMTANHYSNGPVENPESPAIRCYQDKSRKPAAVATVTAGSMLGFKASNTQGHPGPFFMYMAKAPSNVTKWDGSGKVWFKIFEEGAKINNSMVQFHTGLTQVNARVPKSVANGEYLVRVEHVALHKPGSPQFYVACGQIRIAGGGSRSPSANLLVAFPGAYKKSDKSFTYNMYSNKLQPYPMPGPPVWRG